MRLDALVLPWKQSLAGLHEPDCTVVSSVFMSMESEPESTASQIIIVGDKRKYRVHIVFLIFL